MNTEKEALCKLRIAEALLTQAYRRSHGDAWMVNLIAMIRADRLAGEALSKAHDEYRKATGKEPPTDTPRA